jgi:precorrin-6x reductase
MALLTVEGEIDAGIDAAIVHPRELIDVAHPFAGIASDEIVRVAGDVRIGLDLG